jgi:hypothetical protein
VWLSVAVAAMTTGLARHHDYPTLYVWAGVTALACIAPPVHVWIARVAETVPRLLGRLRPVLRSRRIGQVLVAQVSSPSTSCGSSSTARRRPTRPGCGWATSPLPKA